MRKVTFLNNVDSKLLNPTLLEKIKIVANYADLDLEITSGFRTPEKDKAVGGSGKGAHTRGMAVDILCTDSQTAFKLNQAVQLAGFLRYGYEKDHFHCDIDKSLAQRVFWRT